jgi:hypothetical protein
MALAVHYYHHQQGSTRAQHAHDAEVVWASEVQLSAAQLIASQARTQDLELKLTAVQTSVQLIASQARTQDLELKLTAVQTSTLQGQLAKLERKCHGFYEELKQERQKAKQDRDMLKEG